jgi:hypothetical protein
MASTPFTQRNPYKGTTPRCWVRLRLVAADGSLHERELLADTGCPCAIILGAADLALLSRASAPTIGSNFGQLAGAWLELAVPELGLATLVPGAGSDQVFQACQASSSDFAGLAGLPLLRLVEYGGDHSEFWVRKPAANP